MLKLIGGLEDPEFLQQLHSAGVLIQFEGLLSTYGTVHQLTHSFTHMHTHTSLVYILHVDTYAVCMSGDEVGMLEDMEVGVADLSNVAFTVTEAKTEEPDDLLPTLQGTWWETHTRTQAHIHTFRVHHLHSVFFSIQGQFGHRGPVAVGDL